MKWEKLKPPEPDDPMCCCECDVDQYGCCCDCEDPDGAFNRWLKERPPGGGCGPPFCGAIVDKLEISMIPVLVLLPLLLRVAALHYLLGFVVLTALPGLVLWYYHATHRKRTRTLFFLTLALFSLFYMYYLFVAEVLPRGDVGRPQQYAVTAGVALTVACLVRTKRGPGLVAGPPGSVPSAASSAKEEEAPPAAKWTSCPVCKIMRPPRAGHCRTCGSCVQRLDHHCIWCFRINSCVGQANHRSFLLTLCVFLMTSLYGISVVLRSICPRQHVTTALLYCPGVYSQSSTALCFTCAWYSSIVTCGLVYLLVVQLGNISFNVTEREAQQALRKKTGRRRLWGLVVDPGEHSRGFYHNWVEFLTMADASACPRSGLTDLV